MIKVMTMDKRVLAVNIDMIERIETIPETMITLNNGKKMIVLDTLDEVINKVAAYQRSVFSCKLNQIENNLTK